MASAEARAEIARMFAGKRQEALDFPQGKPLDRRRRDWETESRQIVLPRGARFTPVDMGEIKAEWMEMPRVAQDRVMLLLHGGGYNAGSPRTHRKLAAHLSRAGHMRVITPDYQLAPEHPFPAAVKDALKAYGWLLEQGFTDEQIVVAGDSAGGGLALSMMLALREGGAKMPRLAVLLSPWTDLSVSSPSYERKRSVDPAITKEGLGEAGRWYAGERSLTDPMASPLFARLDGLPPMLIHVGGDETMLDDSRLLAEHASAAGVETDIKIWPELWHVFHHAAPDVPEAVQAFNEISAFIRSKFGDHLE